MGQGKEKEIPLNGYWMGKFEVTNKQYATFLNDSRINPQSGCQGKPCLDTKQESQYSHIIMENGNFAVENGYENYPVTDISWYGAIEYCNWLSQKTGCHFKLPNEKQWEKAARWSESKKQSFIFPWGDEKPNALYANFDSKNTEPVDSYEKGASPFGLLNMAGNVWEWCSDLYDEINSSTLQENNSIGGLFRVRRGGGWNSNITSLQSASRGMDIPEQCYSNVGFRLCME